MASAYICVNKHTSIKSSINQYVYMYIYIYIHTYMYCMIYMIYINRKLIIYYNINIIVIL